MERYQARRRAWEIILHQYLGNTKLGCPDEKRLLPHLPAAREHLLSGGVTPWPLLHRDNIAHCEDALDEFRRLAEPLNVHWMDPLVRRHTRWLMDEFQRCEEERPFGTATYKEAYDTALTAAKALYEDLNAAWPPAGLRTPPGKPDGRWAYAELPRFA